MRSKLFIFFFLWAVLFSSASCKKYPDGPKFSLRPKEWRLSGTWKLEQFFINGQDMTSTMYPTRGYSETYETGGNYSFATDTSSGSGRWSWVDKHTRILRSKSAYTPEDATISLFRLENKSLWYKYTTSNGDLYEYHMKQD